MSQDYPTRPVRIVTSPAGGGSDQAARLVAQGLSPLLGQQVIVDNQPAILAPVVVAKSPADSYTVLVAGGSRMEVASSPIPRRATTWPRPDTVGRLLERSRVPPALLTSMTTRATNL